MKLTVAMTVLMTLFANLTLAHDGHNHGPGQVQPTKNGVIMKTEKFFVEVAGSKTEVKIYPLKAEKVGSSKLVSIPLAEVKLTATYSLPRGKKDQAITLTKSADHFLGTVDAQSSHRYQVDVTVEALGEKDKLTFQIEPQE